MADLDIFKNLFVPNIQSFSKLSYSSWKSANPGEAQRWEPYRDAILAGQTPMPPVMTTKFGKALVAAGQLVQQIVLPPPPPSALTWKPPIVGADGVSVVNLALTNANRSNSPLSAGAGRDVVITNPEILTGPIIGGIFGWRHVVWVGGEFQSTANAIGTHIAIGDNSGTVHLEGIKYSCPYSNDVIGLRHSNGIGSTPVVQLQNLNVVNHGDATFHGDIVQTQWALIDSLRFDRCTFTTDYQGFFCLNEPGRNPPAQVGEVLMYRTNFHEFVTGVSPAGSFFAKAVPNTPYAELNLGPWTLNDVWIPDLGNNGGNVGPFNNFHDYTNGNDERYGNFERTDAQGKYIAFSTANDIVPLGSFTGQPALDCGISGVVRIGSHVDFCTTAGINYQSPGYL